MKGKKMAEWYIHTLDRVFAGPDCQAGVERDIGGGTKVLWYRAVCEPYHTFGLERIKAAWAVLTGKAHAFQWPEPGDLERVIAPRDTSVSPQNPSENSGTAGKAGEHD